MPVPRQSAIRSGFGCLVTSRPVYVTEQQPRSLRHSLESDVMKLLILSMRTWGEMGNWLSGHALAEALACEMPSWQVEQLATDHLVPRLAEAGAQIRRLTKQHTQPRPRFIAYTQLMERLTSEYPPGFEEASSIPADLSADLQILSNTITASEPDIVIGTKGIICRLALAATERRLPVVNYVTNHGHFRFAVHSCPSASRHLVRLDAARDFLVDQCGYAQDSVDLVGYLVNASARSGISRESSALPAPVSPYFVVTSNRGGAEYLEVLRHLTAHRRHPCGLFLGLNDPQLCREATTIIDREGLADRWSVLEKLEQHDLMGMMARRERLGPVALVTKASPNSIMEAVYMGVPLFLFRSGLPIEDWSCDLVTANGFGRVEEDAHALCLHIDKELAMDPALAGFSQRELAFAAETLNQAAIRRRIAEALADVQLSESRKTSVQR